MKKEEIDIKIARYLAGEASPEEAIELDDWISSDPEHRKLFEQSAKTVNISLPHTDTSKAWLRLKPGLVKPRLSISYYLVRIAAVLLAVMLGWFVRYNTGVTNPTVDLREDSVFVTGLHANHIELAYGAKVNLFPESKLEKQPGFGKSNRRVKLSGSAYFEISSHDSLPLEVQVSGLRIRDIGTRFLVQSSVAKDSILVRVDEGLVFVTEANGNSLSLKQGEMTIFVTTKPIHKEKSKSDTTGLKFEFTREKLKDIVMQLSRSYKIAIRIKNSEAESCLFTGTFENEDIDTILLIIAETLNLKVDKEKDGYIISGTSCN